MQAPILPTTLVVAAALFAPGAQAQELRRMDPELGRQIAQQGNRALAEIRVDNSRAVRRLAQPVLPDYAALPASIELARTARKDPQL